MAEYIEKEAAILAVSEEHEMAYHRLIGGSHVAVFAVDVKKRINDIPAADVAPVRHGEWFVSIGKDEKIVGTICPICGFAWSEAIDAVKLEPCLSLIKTPFCPNCGAKMDKEETDNG